MPSQNLITIYDNTRNKNRKKKMLLVFRFDNIAVREINDSSIHERNRCFLTKTIFFAVFLINFDFNFILLYKCPDI